MEAMTLPGFLDAQNRNAIDWREGLVAYGCQLLVCVVQAAGPPQLLQCLTGHKLRVAHVCFAPREPRVSSLADAGGMPLLLASADTGGHVILWDVLRGVALCQLPPPSVSGKPSAAVLCLHWLLSRPDHLLCAHASGTLRLWHVTRAGRAAAFLWQSDLNAPPLLIALDPLVTDGARLAVYTARGALHQLRLTPSEPPFPTGAPCSIAAHAAAMALQLVYSPHHAQQVRPEFGHSPPPPAPTHCPCLRAVRRCSFVPSLYTTHALSLHRIALRLFTMNTPTPCTL